ncbi:g5634 [Coccomyxa viridis]|uniref:26S proteasome complex subunit SEM1 n=1 Tax=Coccomyxa viridis TaxID=1274662 RepID=A0ABP1FTD8_9CHLO
MANNQQNKPAVAEDDEFEEFDQEDWDERLEDPKNAQLWDNSWDDDKLDDNFARQLREQLAQPQQQHPPQQQKPS